MKKQIIFILIGMVALGAFLLLTHSNNLIIDRYGDIAIVEDNSIRYEPVHILGRYTDKLFFTDEFDGEVIIADEEPLVFSGKEGDFLTIGDAQIYFFENLSGLVIEEEDITMVYPAHSDAMVLEILQDMEDLK